MDETRAAIDQMFNTLRESIDNRLNGIESRLTVLENEYHMNEILKTYSNNLRYNNVKDIVLENRKEPINSPLGEVFSKALYKNDLYSIKFLLKYININDKYRDGSTPLIISVKKGFNEIAELLISSEADINEKDKYEYSALHFAIKYKNEAIIKILIEEQANLYYKDIKSAPQNLNDFINGIIDDIKSPNYNKSIFVASKEGNLENVKFLILNCGTFVNEKDDDGKTALHHASERGEVEIVNFLIEQGANVNIKDNHGRNSLHYASSEGHINVVQVLIDAGSNVNQKDENYKTALFLALENQRFDVFDLLVEYCRDINQKDYDGKSLLHITSNIEKVQMLINKGINVNIKDRNGKTPLHVASYNGDLEYVKFLINNKANINIKDKQSKTPLVIAIENNQDAVAEFIRTNI